ncbi:hypothetical protein LNQ03_20350 [Klebsiella pneumoniae subsp. pneumoniae]|nr:hypothetical protein [Klebsiella pneumoniae subsp. pneumoniae]
MLLQLGNDRFHIGFSIEQADYVGIPPQAGFPGNGSNTGVSCRILEGDRDRSGLHQRIAKIFSVRAGGI